MKPLLSKGFVVLKPFGSRIGSWKRDFIFYYLLLISFNLSSISFKSGGKFLLDYNVFPKQCRSNNLAWFRVVPAFNSRTSQIQTISDNNMTSIKLISTIFIWSQSALLACSTKSTNSVG
jgi:hypothetical protein